MVNHEPSSQRRRKAADKEKVSAQVKVFFCNGIRFRVCLVRLKPNKLVSRCDFRLTKGAL